MNTQRKPFQPRFKTGLTQPLIQCNAGEVKKALAVQAREHDTHFTVAVRQLAMNKRADSVVKANTLVWLQQQADRNAKLI